MDIKQEKKKFLEKVIAMSFDQVKEAEIRQQLHDLLLHDTNGGKLYKYRTFDKKGYALKNLKEGTMHCSKPLYFNDPFDNKIGIRIQNLFEIMYTVQYQMVDAILDKFKGIEEGGIDYNECNIEEQRIIKKLYQNEKVMNVVRKSTADEPGEMLDEEEGRVFVAGLMQTILEDEVFKGPVGDSAKDIPRLVKDISSEQMMQFMDTNYCIKDLAHLHGIDDDTDEIGYMMLLCKKLCPEYLREMEERISRIEIAESKINDILGNKFRIGCLSTDYKNRLMWSHYADSHSGFCIEYDFSDNREDTLSKLPYPIIYTSSRPQVPWEAVLENTSENVRDANMKLAIGLLTKDDVWEYENEWRILIESKNTGEFKMPKMSCIYLGANISKKNRKKILKIAKKKNVSVKQMKMDHGEYDLHVEAVWL